jgi:SAM-dependent methyltransferase
MARSIVRRFPIVFRPLVTLSRQGVLPYHPVTEAIAKEVGMPFPREHWARTVMYRECTKLIAGLDPSTLDVLEISPGAHEPFASLGFRSTTRVDYPGFDVCRDRLEADFDLVIADQVFEHLLWPYRAGTNVHRMLKDGGHFLIMTPFLVRIHNFPADCSRWTEIGLKYFLAECGFSLDAITTGSWGNRSCVVANFRTWAIQTRWRSLRNEPDFPVVVWALAKKTGGVP